jgi:hypothetical protein
MKQKTKIDSLVINQGMEMPEDFWNYIVNPIVGYHYKMRKNDWDSQK